jgi:hypothetical protein
VKSAFLRKRAALGVAAFLLTACAGGAAGVPAGGALQAQASRMQSDAAINLSGQYKGTVTLSPSQKLQASLDLGQYKAAVGGSMTIESRTPPTSDVVVWTVDGNKLAGTIVSPSGPCVFATTATYNSTTHVLGGKFSPAHGCSASAGATFRLRHQCTYHVPARGDVLPDAGGVKMC